MINVYYIDYDPKRVSNGVSAYSEQYLSAIADQKDIRLSCIWLDSLPGSAEAKSQTIDSIDHYYLPKHVAKTNSLNKSEWTANLLSKIMIGNSPIIHINWISHCEIIGYLRWRINFKVVLTKHCIPWRDSIVDNYQKFLEIESYFQNKKRLPFLHPAYQNEGFYYGYLDHIITVTKQSRESLQYLFNTPAENISVIYNGVEFEKDSSQHLSKKQLRKKYGYKDKEKLVLFAGRISLKKGVLDLVEAFNLVLKQPDLKHAKLLIAGEGEYSLLFKYTDIMSHIVLTGHITKQKLFELYTIADLGVIPSYIEQCSFTMIEMMRAKLPILVADTDGLRELIDDRIGTTIKLLRPVNGWASFDKIDFAAGIATSLQHEAQSTEKAHACYKYAKETFSLPRMMQETFIAYTKTFNSSNIRDEFKVRRDLPKVSILLPVHNGARYIADCIESVLAQTYEKFELIIVDDASDDNTSEILNTFNDSRIIKLKNKYGKGISYSLNRGIKRANGKYVARIDSDDIMLPNRLHEQLFFLENNTDYAMVGSWYSTIDHDGKHITTFKPVTDNEDLKLLLLFGNQIAHPTVMMQTEVLREFKYSNKFRYCEDYSLWLKIIYKYKLANIPIVLNKYRVHEKNISKQFANTQQKNSIELVVRKLTSLKIKLTTDDILIHAAIMMKLGDKYFLKQGNLNKAEQWIEKVITSLSFLKYDCEDRQNVKKYILNEYCLINKG